MGVPSRAEIIQNLTQNYTKIMSATQRISVDDGTLTRQCALVCDGGCHSENPFSRCQQSPHTQRVSHHTPTSTDILSIRVNPYNPWLI